MDSLGAELRWNVDTNTATLLLGNIGVAISVDVLTMTIRDMTTEEMETRSIPVAPRIYEDVLFAPVEHVASAMGLRTEQDDTNGSLHIMTVDFVPSVPVVPGTNPMPVAPIVESDIRPFNISRGISEFPASGTFRMAGVTYNNGLVKTNPTGGATAYFNVEGIEYTHLSGIFGPTDGGSSFQRDTIIFIFGDDNLLKELVSRVGAMPNSFSAIIPSGTRQLRIEFQDSGFAHTNNHAVANITFSREPIINLPVLPVRLTTDSARIGVDIRAYQLAGGVNEYPASGTFRMAGTTHNNGLQKTTATSGAIAYYNIDGLGFTRISGIFGPTDGGSSFQRDTLIYIFGDDVLLAELESRVGAMPESFNANIPIGTRQLRFEFRDSGFAHTNNHALADLILTIE
jgi:hypothetical protein